MYTRPLQQAQQLIDAKRYAEAREILEQVDHPTAYDWLVLLDEISPEPLKPLPKQGPGGTLLVWLGLLGWVVAVIVFVARPVPAPQERQAAGVESVIPEANDAAPNQSAENNAALLTQTDTPLPVEAPTLVPAETFYVTLSANARSCASTECETVTILNSGTSVEVVGSERGQALRGNTTWRLVLVDGQITYVHASLLSPTAP